ncbi:MAG: alkaline shock response membrane anchor protein AmaP [Candidatus Omnitrophica bacterium]|nr:alkaline shock response membrane anchor protein AmaP [Candidatus Omnitrophota bacterium]
MKVFDLFTKIFSVFAFLTIGSLLLMVALHIVAWNDLARDLGRLYEEPVAQIQAFLIGIFFIFMGLAFAKILIKQTRYAGGLVYTGPLGRTTVSINAVTDVVRKALKKFPEILTFTLKCRSYETKAEIKVYLVLQEGAAVPRFTDEVKQEILSRLRKVLGLIVDDVEIFIEVRSFSAAGGAARGGKGNASFDVIPVRKAS